MGVVLDSGHHDDQLIDIEGFWRRATQKTQKTRRTTKKKLKRLRDMYIFRKN